MLQLRPNCEHCNTPLPPDSPDARICSYECTFCARCVEAVLHNVCPNCGGGFAPRPIRPARQWVGCTGLAAHPATSTVTYRPVDPAAHAALLAAQGGLPPERR
ncbi:DUF1272 domain-containing protein [Vogesella urethralis]|uniref:DUF1272 domain-containing protein n=1 Tax=Vogesella urethralis TaxID=2592656 RepID=UPI0011861F75|nr:DUF1272 domain-containing protein [Vogesella urethralis]